MLTNKMIIHKIINNKMLTNKMIIHKIIKLIIFSMQ
jgi:hypothetical protein